MLIEYWATIPEFSLTAEILSGYPSRYFTVLDLMLHRGDYEEFCLLGYNAIYTVESDLKFQRNVLLPNQAMPTTCFLLVSCLAYFSTMKM
jgi:hypothetical protein